MAKTPTWQRAAGKNPEGGLNEAGRRSLRAAGHDIKRPQPEGGSRKKSFCARMKGMKAKLTSSETANDPDSRINKSLRKWKCADGGEVTVENALRLTRKGDKIPLRPYEPRWNEVTGKFDSPQNKGIGFAGPLKQRGADHVVSEYSRDADFQYPTIHSGMSAADRAAVMESERLSEPKYHGDDIISERLNRAQRPFDIPQDVDRRAYGAAQERIEAGRSPFFEQGRDPYPAWSPEQHWEEPAVMPNRADPLMYADGGEVVVENALRMAQGRPDEKGQERFLREQLAGSALQYEPEAGIETAKEAGRMVASMTTPGAIADAAGYMGTPSALQNVREGNYGAAALQLAGALPGLGPLTKAAKIAESSRPIQKLSQKSLWEEIARHEANIPEYSKESEALTGWVGVPVNAVERKIYSGFMIPKTLEEMEPQEFAELNAPIKKLLQEYYGETIPVYRGIVEEKPQSYGRLNKYASYSTSPEVAQIFAGVTSGPINLISEKEITKAEKELAKKGKTKIFGHNIINEEVLPGVRTNMLYKGSEAITDVDDIRSWAKAHNEDIIKFNANRKNKLKNISQYNIPVSDVLWATNRALQNEIIAPHPSKYVPGARSGGGQVVENALRMARNMGGGTLYNQLNYALNSPTPANPPQDPGPQQPYYQSLSQSKDASQQYGAPAPGAPTSSPVRQPMPYAKGGKAVWNKPRPKSLGKPEPLSPSQKSSAKAMAKAAGRPYPNFVDNIRAAKKATRY